MTNHFIQMALFQFQFMARNLQRKKRFRSQRGISEDENFFQFRVILIFFEWICPTCPRKNCHTHTTHEGEKNWKRSIRLGATWIYSVQHRYVKAFAACSMRIWMTGWVPVCTFSFYISFELVEVQYLSRRRSAASVTGTTNGFVYPIKNSL